MSFRLLVIFDGTTLDLHACDVLAAEFGVPEGGRHPKLRAVGLLQAGTVRWKAAAVGGYHDGENALCDQLQDALAPGQLCLADRGFFSADRWLRFSGTGADLLWRVRNGARSVPFRHLRTLKDGSELVLLRESAGMLGRRRKDAGDRTLARLPGYRRPPRLLHHRRPHPPRPVQEHPGPCPDHPPGPRRVPRPLDRGVLFPKAGSGNRVPPPQENRPGNMSPGQAGPGQPLTGDGGRPPAAAPESSQQRYRGGWARR